MSFSLQIHKIAQGLKPYYQQFWDFVDAVEAALNSNLSAIEVLQGQVGAGANDNIGDIRITSGALPAAQYLGPIPYPAGLTNLSKEIYANLYATAGFSGSDSALWTQETSGVTGDINAVIHTGTNYIAYGAAGIGLYSLDGSTWNEVGDIGGTAPASAVNAAAYNSNEHAVVFVVGNGAYIGASADYGKTITAKSLTFVESYDIRDIKEFNGVFYIVGMRVVGSTYYSAVASFTYNSGTGVITWLSAAENIPGQYSAIQFDGTTYVIIAGNNGTTASTARSSNLTVWTTVGTHTGFANYKDIIFFGGVWVVAGSKDGLNGAVRYSMDSGETWVTVDTGAKNLNFARYDAYNSQFVFGGAADNGATFIYTWQNGDPTATPQNTGASVSLNDYAENGFGQSIIVGNGGNIYSFAAYGGDFSVLDTSDITGNAREIYSVGVNGTELLASSYDATNLYLYNSTDNGATWTLRNTFAHTATLSGASDTTLEYDAVNGKYIAAIANRANSSGPIRVFQSSTLTGTFTVGLSLNSAFAPSCARLAIDSQNGVCVFANAAGTDFYVSTNGGVSFTNYSESFTSNRNHLNHIGGYFVITEDNGNIVYSATGLNGSWTRKTVTGAGNSSCAISYVNGNFYYINNGNAGKIWKSNDISNLGSALTANCTFASYSAFGALNGVLIAKIDTGGGNFIGYSSDGLTWQYVDGATTDIVYSSIRKYNDVFAGGMPIVISGGDDFSLLNYAPNVVSGTFDIPWPYPSQTLAAPYSAYIKWDN